MRKFYLILCTVLCQYVFGQNNVGIGIATPAASALLDLTSSNQGFLVPRMSAANRLLIAQPATGLIVYDMDSTCTFFYTGTQWQNMCVTQSAGGFNDSIYFNPLGTVSVVDKGGTHTSPQSAWLTTGNTGTNAASNYAGTSDAQNFVMKSGGAEVMRLTTAGAADIGAPPAEDANAVLNIYSASKGILVPSLSSAARDAIAAPTPGLTIYNTTLNVHQYYNGTCWADVGQSVCSFTYSTTQNQTNGCLFKSNFGSVSDTLTLTLLSGTASPVVLSASGVPAGVLVNFSSTYVIPTGGGVQSIMTLTALPTAPDGNFTITILATSGSTVQQLTYNLTVYDFAVTITPPSSTVTLTTAQAGGVIATATVSIGSAGSGCITAGGTAQLSYSISPSNPGLQVSFGNSNPPVPGTTTMNISSNCALQGTYQIVVTSQIGVSVTSTIYTLTITGPTPFLISSNTQNINLFIFAGSPSCPVIDTFIVEAGVTVGSATAAQTAAASSMETGTFAPGSKIVIVNMGSIIGAGGAGGNGSGYGGAVIGGNCTQLDGQQGGNAIWVNTPSVIIDNLGVIASGGGGGGAGQALGTTECTLDVRPGTGGGGGQGSVGGAGGSDGGGSYPTSAGTAGTVAAFGVGGTQYTVSCTQFGFPFGPFVDGVGGDGGALGKAGSIGGTTSSAILGATGVCPNGNGGNPGYSIVGNGNSPIINGATVIGPQLP